MSGGETPPGVDRGANSNGEGQATVYAFLDTNVFLHYQAFETIPWPTVLGCDRVVLLVARIVFKELEKWRHDARARRAAQRARDAVPKVTACDGVSDAASPWRLDVVKRHPPNSLLEDEGLVRQDADDCLIGSVLDWQLMNPGRKCVLVAGDGPLLTVARDRMETVRIPDVYKLRDEPDPRDTTIRELKSRVAELEDRLPKLNLTFANGETHLAARLGDFSGIEDEPEDGDQTLDLPNEMLLGAARYLHSVGGAATPDYLLRHDEFQRRRSEYYGLVGRMVELPLLLANSGTCPARVIRVRLNFTGPPGMEVDWERPNAPRPLLGSPAARNVLGPQISAEPPGAEYQVRVLQHEDHVALGPLYVTFANERQAGGFSIMYSLICDELPQPETGKLSVSVADHPA